MTYFFLKSLKNFVFLSENVCLVDAPWLGNFFSWVEEECPREWGDEMKTVWSPKNVLFKDWVVIVYFVCHLFPSFAVKQGKDVYAWEQALKP